ncbi:hypothetical protein [Thiomicrorhabdus sediminis]|uniref:Uncharacterized protein n=1 Tax=Thiomicrorhabdus sediminis TaxID=2580412 RepID=A0A4P9K8P7_9GAMM|nr:hypothetical protein [Thiomicrorhabdus sediminis]QCU90786.1 hypothetical protein FE785_09170 [Thiomicrorhabdus sediminis]
MRDLHKQSGYIVLMGMLVLMIGAMVWFGASGNVMVNRMMLQSNNEEVTQLEQIKQKMLAYAVMHPEVFANVTPKPGVGYFPCPDVDGDGLPDNPCGIKSGTDQLYVFGNVPYQNTLQNFNFLDKQLDSRLYWFAVDSRFVENSALYSFATSSRFAPLNDQLDTHVTDIHHKQVAPILLDGDDEIVMVLFYAGDTLASQARPSVDAADYLEQPVEIVGENIGFNSTGTAMQDFNDYVIAITRSEWQAAMLMRLSRDNSPADQIPDMCVSVGAAGQHWFNDCSYNSTSRPIYSCDGVAIDNLAGQGWRSLLCE